jgi:hypothetical protein
MNLDCNKIFEEINVNINDKYIVDINIDILATNFYLFNYDDIINNIIFNLDDTTFIINCLNKLLDNITEYKKTILIDIINGTNNINKLKHLFLLENINYKLLYDIYKFKSLSVDNYIDIYDFLLIIGKINIIEDLLQNCSTKINQTKLIVLLSSIFSFHQKLETEYIYSEFTLILIKFINKILPFFELTEIINNLFIFNNDNSKLELILEFYKLVIDKYEIYFNINAIDKSIEILNIIVKNNLSSNNYKYILDTLINLINSSYLNIHEKFNLFIDITKILIDDKSNYVPINYLDQMIYIFENIKFLTWITIDEKISVFNILSKILLKIKKLNKLSDNINNYDTLLYHILYFENECFNLLTNLLNMEIEFNIYNLMKESVYNFIAAINIFTEICDYYFDNIKDKYIKDLFYKNNLNISVMLNYINDNNIYKLSKFNTDILLKNIIISKLIIIYKHCDNIDYPSIGLDYENLINYIETKNINIFYDINTKINLLENKFNSYNDNLDNLNQQYIDNIFNIEILDPIMLPNLNDFFEKTTLYLLIRETNKNPYTRESINLDELIEYNNRDDIKDKINNFIKDKK